MLGYNRLNLAKLSYVMLNLAKVRYLGKILLN
jgi:hypothetical protein